MGRQQFPQVSDVTRECAKPSGRGERGGNPFMSAAQSAGAPRHLRHNASIKAAFSDSSRARRKKAREQVDLKEQHRVCVRACVRARVCVCLCVWLSGHPVVKTFDVKSELC